MEIKFWKLNVIIKSVCVAYCKLNTDLGFGSPGYGWQKNEKKKNIGLLSLGDKRKKVYQFLKNIFNNVRLWISVTSSIFFL